MSGELILGIDGGGSKTLVAIANRSGEAIRIAAGGGTNPMDNPRWREELAATVGAVAPDRLRLAGAAVGMASYGEVDTVTLALRQAVAALLNPVPHRVLNDVDAAHAGAFANGPGILMLAGTGSMAWARDAGGAACRVGGWGDGFGDEGSAHWIGLQAVSLASRHLDGRAEAPGLVAALFATLGLDRDRPLDALAGWFATRPHRRSAVAGLAPLVDQLAGAGDGPARAIIEAAAAELALHVTAILSRPGYARLEWSYAGGAFRSRNLLDALVRRVGRAPRPPLLQPIGGALLCAATDLAWPVDRAWIERLAASLAGQDLAGPHAAALLPENHVARPAARA